MSTPPRPASETPSLEEIMVRGSNGPEPSAGYLKSLDLLDNVVRECIHVSHEHGGIPSPSTRHFYASVLFTSLVTKGVSLLIFCPLSPWAEKAIEHWDYGSLTGIARSMMETRLNFYYLCVEACSDGEWDCRWNLFNLHDCTARIRFFEAQQLMTGKEVADLPSFNVQADELRGRLTANAFFSALPEKQQRKLLKGRDAHLFPLEELAERAGVGVGQFRYLHILFSQHIHSLPMSFYRMGGDEPDRGRGLPSTVEENYTALCLSLAATMLTSVRDELHELFAGVTNNKHPKRDPSSDQITP